MKIFVRPAIALVSAIMCVFPYMAHIYQYNTTMAPYPAAHLLAALAIVLATTFGLGLSDTWRDFRVGTRRPNSLP